MNLSENPQKIRKPKVFISYRKHASEEKDAKVGIGTQVSSHLHEWLKSKRKDLDVFHDSLIDDDDENNYWTLIKREISKADYCILILPKDALARCYDPDEEKKPDDVFGYEIRDALRKNDCKIIPLFVVNDSFEYETGKVFRDAQGKAIRNYEELPWKFKKEAEKRELLLMQAYAIIFQESLIPGSYADKALGDTWKARFGDDSKIIPKSVSPQAPESKLPSAPRKSSLPLLALATAVAAGGVFFLKYRHADAPAEPKAPAAVAPVEPDADARKKADEEKAAREREEAEKAKKEEARRKAEEERLRREAEEKNARAAANAAMHDALAAAAKEYVDDKADAAVIRKRLEDFEAAWDKGAEPKPKELSAALILSAAESKKMPRLVRRLLDAGANPNARDSWGETPLHNAARGGDAECVRLLLERGADRSLRNSNGKTPADLAAANSELQALLR